MTRPRSQHCEAGTRPRDTPPPRCSEKRAALYARMPWPEQEPAAPLISRSPIADFSLVQKYPVDLGESNS